MVSVYFQAVVVFIKIEISKFFFSIMKLLLVLTSSAPRSHSQCHSHCSSGLSQLWCEKRWPGTSQDQYPCPPHQPRQLLRHPHLLQEWKQVQLFLRHPSQLAEELQQP